jgi:hypothetical protein
LKPDTAKTDTPRGDTAKADAPKADAPKADAPKADALKADTLKPDTLRPDALKPDAPPPPPLSVQWYSAVNPCPSIDQVAIAGGGTCTGGKLRSSTLSLNPSSWTVTCTGSAGETYVACANVSVSPVSLANGPCQGATPDLLGFECGCNDASSFIVAYEPSSANSWTCSCSSGASPTSKGLCANVSGSFTRATGPNLTVGEATSLASCGAAKVVSGGCVAPDGVGIKGSRPDSTPGVGFDPSGWYCEFADPNACTISSPCHAVALCYKAP